MNFTATLLFAAAAVASVSAADCSAAEAGKAFIALSPLLAGPYLGPCAESSGYDMLQSKGLPTDEQYVKMCKLDTCKNLIKAVAATNPPNCVLVIPTSQAKMNVYELANGFDGQCARVAGPAPTSAPPATTPAPVGQTPAPVGQTPAPVGQTPAPAGKTPAPASPSAAPTPTKVAC